jgi:hypothetical protein
MDIKTQMIGIHGEYYALGVIVEMRGTRKRAVQYNIGERGNLALPIDAQILNFELSFSRCSCQIIGMFQTPEVTVKHHHEL